MATTKKPKGKSSADALEKAILQSPDTADAYLVYADYLTELGDPFGEFITVLTQAETAAGDKKKKLEKRAHELLTTHKNDWLGSIAQWSDFHGRRNPFTGQMQSFPPRPLPTLRFGFVNSVRVFGAEDLEELFALRIGRFVRTLEIQPPYEPTIAKLAELGVPRTVSRLSFVLGEHDQLSWMKLGDLSVLYPQLKQLKELQVTAGEMTFGDIALPALKSFEVITGGLTRANVRDIARAKWPKLEKLILYFGDPTYGANARKEDLRPILEGRGISRVSHLGLCNSVHADDIAKAIVKSTIVKQLDILDLSKGAMTDAGASALVKGAAKLQQLKRLDLSQNFISEDAQEELVEAFGAKVDLSRQGDEDDHYVQVAE